MRAEMDELNSGAIEWHNNRVRVASARGGGGAPVEWRRAGTRTWRVSVRPGRPKRRGGGEGGDAARVGGASRCD